MIEWHYEPESGDGTLLVNDEGCEGDFTLEGAVPVDVLEELVRDMDDWKGECDDVSKRSGIQLCKSKLQNVIEEYDNDPL